VELVIQYGVEENLKKESDFGFFKIILPLLKLSQATTIVITIHHQCNV
jgi:hypothetical protein